MSIPEITTPHLEAAAFLLVRGYKSNRTFMDGGKAFFAFLDDGGGEKAIDEFYGGAAVSAVDYAAALKRIKDLLWEAKRQRGNGNEAFRQR